MKGRQTICLNMIVKDEAHVIRRCLGSLRDFVDYWVIVDTGSSDGTQEAIRDFMQGVPGELLERPWVDFATNRTEALRAARAKADYLFILDADEILERDPDFVLPQLVKDVYLVETLSAGVSYWKQQLVNNRLDWEYRGILHEYIHCQAPTTEEHLEGLRIVRYTDGARSQDPLTYRKDALLLEQALLEEPDNSRHVFYLAQSYRDAGELELALKHYRRRIEMGGWPEEVWYSLYQTAEIMARLDKDWLEVLGGYLDGYRYRPWRAEPLFKIAMFYQRRREFALAHLFLSRALELPPPRQELLFVEKDVYKHWVAVEYAVACHWIGDYSEAIRCANALLCSGDLPAEIFDQVLRNQNFSIDALWPKLEEPLTGPLKLKVGIPFRDPGHDLDNCIESLLLQDYDDFEMIFVDDGSSDGSARKVPVEDPRVTLISHSEPRGRGAVLHRLLGELCEPDDVFVEVEGSDWLAAPDALSHLSEIYRQHGCWAVYGQFRYASGHYGLALPFPDETAFAQLRREPFHPRIRSFRAGLHHRIGDQDPEWTCLKDELGNWLDGDAGEALMLAAMELAGFARVRFNHRVLYVRNEEIPGPEAVPASSHRARAPAARLQPIDDYRG